MNLSITFQNFLYSKFSKDEKYANGVLVPRFSIVKNISVFGRDSLPSSFAKESEKKLYLSARLNVS